MNCLVRFLISGLYLTPRHGRIELRQPASITFGDLDARNCDSKNALFFPRVAGKNWAVRLDRLTVGSTFSARDLPSSRLTSTNFTINASATINWSLWTIFGPQPVIDRIATLFGAVPFKDIYYTIPCDKRNSSSMSFYIQEHEVQLRPEDLIVEVGGANVVRTV